jgi:predicted esterase
MPRFFKRLAEGVFDLDDLKARTSDLAEFVAAAASQYEFDPARVVALGYSNGAYIAASLLLSRPGVLAAAILLRAMVPFEPERLPVLQGTSVLLSAGRQDPMIPQASTSRLAALLKQAGADVTLSWYDAGHGLVPREMEQATRWFGERLA